MAIALGRYLLPQVRVEDPTEAYLLALEHVCTTLTKGWFRDFAASNFRTVWNQLDTTVRSRASSLIRLR
jgi:hypothetical protein